MESKRSIRVRAGPTAGAEHRRESALDIYGDPAAVGLSCCAGRLVIGRPDSVAFQPEVDGHVGVRCPREPRRLCCGNGLRLDQRRSAGTRLILLHLLDRALGGLLQQQFARIGATQIYHADQQRSEDRSDESELDYRGTAVVPREACEAHHHSTNLIDLPSKGEAPEPVGQTLSSSLLPVKMSFQPTICMHFVSIPAVPLKV